MTFEFLQELLAPLHIMRGINKNYLRGVVLELAQVQQIGRGGM